MNRCLAWQDWAAALARAVASVSDDALLRAAALLRDAAIVLTAGNGGSASLASHASQAIAKPNYAPVGGRSSVCLTDHVPTITAMANDIGWADALVESGRPFIDEFGPRCALLLISSSGKSHNVVRLARLGSERGCPIVALTGFDGEPLRSIANVSLHVASDDYEVVEPVHDALVHRVQYHLRAIGGSEASL